MATPRAIWPVWLRPAGGEGADEVVAGVDTVTVAGVNVANVANVANVEVTELGKKKFNGFEAEVNRLDEEVAEVETDDSAEVTVLGKAIWVRVEIGYGCRVVVVFVAQHLTLGWGPEPYSQHQVLGPQLSTARPYP